MWPVIRFLGLTLPVAPVFALLAFIVGTDLGERMLGRGATAEERVRWQGAFNSAVWLALVAGIIGARLGFVARYTTIYLDAPQLILSIRPGALALLPGLLAGGAIGLFLLTRKQIPLAWIGDAVVVGVTGALAVLSVGRFLTGSDYGTPTTMPWGVELWQTARHPVQLYETGLLLIALLLLWWQQRTTLPGANFWRGLAYLSAVELFVDAFRANAQTWFLGVHAVQVIALGILLAALYVLSFYAGLSTAKVGVASPEQVQS